MLLLFLFPLPVSVCSFTHWQSFIAVPLLLTHKHPHVQATVMVFNPHPPARSQKWPQICASRWKAFSFVSSSDQPSAHLSSQPGVAAGSFNGLSASRKSAHEVRRFGGWVGPFDLGQWPLTWWFLTSPFLYMSTHQTSTTSYYSRKRHFLDDALWAGLFSFSFF